MPAWPPHISRAAVRIWADRYGCVLLKDAVAESSLELRACRAPGTGTGALVESLRAVTGTVQAVVFAAGGGKLLTAVGDVITL